MTDELRYKIQEVIQLFHIKQGPQSKCPYYVTSKTVKHY